MLLRFARVYGFRNIQTLVRKIKRHQQQLGVGGVGEPPYDFVEVMACPGGCLNGGGQMKAAGASVQEMLDAAEASYYAPSLRVTTRADEELTRAFDAVVAGGELMRTSFKALEPAAGISLAGVANSW